MNFLWDNFFRKNKQGNELQTAIKDNVLFQDLSGRELALVENIVHFRRYHAGETIFRRGDVGAGMYVIVRGRVEIFVSDPLAESDENRQVFIAQLVAGDFFGELSLVEENGRRTASALAREDTHLIGFFKPDLLQILERSPSTGIKIVFRLAEVLGARLKETTNKVSELRKAVKELREPPPLGVSGDGGGAHRSEA